MRTIARVRPKNNVFDIHDNLTDDDSLVLFDVMDDRSFFKKTPQSLTQHTSSIENITRACDTGLRRQQQAYGYKLPDTEIIEAYRIPRTGYTPRSDLLCGLADRLRHRVYASCRRSSILYKPQGCCMTHFAARRAPLAKVSRLWERWTSSRRSPGPPNSTVCSPTISPVRTT